MRPNILKETMRGMQTVVLEDEMLLNREIFLTQEINTITSTDLIKQLMYLEKTKPGEPVVLYINSPGGDVNSGLAVYDYIGIMKSPVYTVCVGCAASMGAILFLAGEKRKMLRNSRVMIHDPSFASGSVSGKKPHEIQERLNQLLDVREKLASIIAERSGMSMKQVYRKTKYDTYINAEDAVKLGIATEILS